MDHCCAVHTLCPREWYVIGCFELIRAKDRRIRIAVDGRPQALDGFDYVTLFDETLFLDTKNKLPVDKVKEIAQVIGAICLPAQK